MKQSGTKTWRFGCVHCVIFGYHGFETALYYVTRYISNTLLPTLTKVKFIVNDQSVGMAPQVSRQQDTFPLSGCGFAHTSKL